MKKGKDLPEKVAQIAPVTGLGEILKLEEVIAADISTARAKAQKMVSDAQESVDSIEIEGQENARLEAAHQISLIEARTHKEIEEIGKLGIAECDELDSKLASRLTSALDYIVDQVVEGDSCLTRRGVTQC